MLPDAVAAATAALDEIAVKVSVSPSGSMKYAATSTTTALSTSTTCSEMLPTGWGA